MWSPTKDCLSWVSGMHPGETAEHEAAHGGVDERLVRSGQALVVTDQAAAVQEPRESSLHDPAAREHALEALLAFDGDPFEAEAGDWVHNSAEAALPGAPVLHDLDAPAEVLLDPLSPAAGVALVEPHVLQAWELLGDPVQEQRDGGPFLDGGRMDDGLSTKPRVSTTMWRVRPLIFLPPSK